MTFRSLLPLSIVLIVLGCSKSKDPAPANQLTSCFNVQTGTLTAQQNIQFTSCSHLAVTWLWEFGDGYGSTSENPTHSYNQGGTFTVKLTTSDGSKTQLSTKQITVAKALVFFHPSNTISHDSAWVTGVHIVTGTIKVNGAKLTIQPGAVVRFQDGGDKRIEVGSTGFASSTFIANGTSTAQIQFISNSSSAVNSTWGAINIGPNTTSSSGISYATIQNGGATYDYNRINAPVEFMDGGTISITNTTISNSTKYGIYLSPSSVFTTFTNNTIDLGTQQGYPICIDGDNLSTFVESSNTIKGKALLLTNTNITTSVTFNPYSLPYFADYGLFLGNTTRTTVTVNAGCIFNFGGGASIMIGAAGYSVKLAVAGTAAKPVIFQSLDPLQPWSNIRWTSEFGLDSYMDYAQIKTAVNTNVGDGIIAVNGSTKLNLTNSYVNGDGILVYMTQSAQLGSFTNNTFDKVISYHNTMSITSNQFQNFPTGNTFLHQADDPYVGIYVSAANVSTNCYNIAQDFTITNAGAPYFMSGYISVGNSTSPSAGPTLTILPGADLRFNDYNGLIIGAEDQNSTPGLDAKLIMNGTSTSPIHLGIRPSFTFWGGVSLLAGTNAATSLNYVVLEGGKDENLYININNSASATPYPVIQNSSFKNAGLYPIYVETNSKPDIKTSNTYTGNGTNSVFYH